MWAVTCGLKQGYFAIDMLAIRRQKKNPVLQADGPRSVGRSGLVTCLLFCFVSGAKMTLKTQKFWKKSNFFCRKSFEMCSDLFSTYFSKNFNILVKKWLILQDFDKLRRKKFSQMEKNGLIIFVKQVLFCSFFPRGLTGWFTFLV